MILSDPEPSPPAGKKVLVVGGGPAGLFAAGRAAERGAGVLLVEKMDRLGRKLGISGKGRCNLTNVLPIEEFISRFGSNGPFLRQAFHHFFSEDLTGFLQSRGVGTVVERGGRVFPSSGHASDVVQVLKEWLRGLGVRILTRAKVSRLVVESGRAVGVEFVLTGSSRQPLEARIRMEPADAVVIATGGASYPATGSTGEGYRMAESVGHTIVPPKPALVPVETFGDGALRLQGISLKNVGLSVFVDGRKHAEAFGEMLFTHFGISGPIVLTLSKSMVEALSLGRSVSVSIDLKPALDHARLDARLLRDLAAYGRRPLRTILKGLLPQKMILFCLDTVGLSPDKAAHQVTAEERKRLRLWLKDFRLGVSGHRPLDEAIVTAGGVRLKEINPRSMESHLVKNLYFAGEILDVDADTGGFNMQAAVSTGWLAGESAAGTRQPG